MAKDKKGRNTAVVNDQTGNAAFDEALFRFSAAESAYIDNMGDMDSREELYQGTREIEINPNTKQGEVTKPKLAPNVGNIIFEFIESQIDSNIPSPKCDPLSEADVELATIIEDSLRFDLMRLDFDAMNDSQERTCPVQGMSFFEVFYDRTRRGHSWAGDINVRILHPKSFIPQPGVHGDINDMDYFFVVMNVTKEYIRRRYGEAKYHKIKETVLTKPEVSKIGDQDSANEDDVVTEVTYWYRNSIGRPGRMVWIGDVLLESYDDYYARMLERCTECGAIKPIDGNECENCGGKKFTKAATDKEPVTEPIMRSHGLPIMPETVQKNRDGTEAMRIKKFLGIPLRGRDGSPMIEPATVPTEIPFYLPTSYPIVMRENVPKNFAFGGQSDVDIIRDQANEIKKALTAMSEKNFNGGSIVEAPESMRGRFDTSNDELKILWVKPNEKGSVKVYGLQPEISQHVQYYQMNYQMAQNTLGITNSFQGKPDATAVSGRAKQIQITQSAGRLQSKKTNKYAAYKKLFKLMFQFKLAFLDEPRGVLSNSGDGTTVFRTFNRYDFLNRDDAGEWYYNDEFVFSVDPSGSMAADRELMLNTTLNFFTVGMYGDTTQISTLIDVWGVLVKLHYPGAADQLAKLKKRQQDMLLAQSMVPMLPMTASGPSQDVAQQVQNAAVGNNINPQGAAPAMPMQVQGT